MILFFVFFFLFFSFCFFSTFALSFVVLLIKRYHYKCLCAKKLQCNVVCPSVRLSVTRCIYITQIVSPGQVVIVISYFSFSTIVPKRTRTSRRGSRVHFQSRFRCASLIATQLRPVSGNEMGGGCFFVKSGPFPTK